MTRAGVREKSRPGPKFQLGHAGIVPRIGHYGHPAAGWALPCAVRNRRYALVVASPSWQINHDLVHRLLRKVAGDLAPDLWSTSDRPAAPLGDGRRARPEGRHRERRLGKGPVGRLAPPRPRTPIREASSAARLARNCRRQRLASMVMSQWWRLGFPGRPGDVRVAHRLPCRLRVRSREEVKRFRRSTGAR
jgi:hypothetical protein